MSASVIGLPLSSISLNGPPIAEGAKPVPRYWVVKKITPRKITKPAKKCGKYQ